jgi:hypothetical protein
MGLGVPIPPPPVPPSEYPPDDFGRDAIGRAFTDAAEHERLKQAVLDAALAWEASLDSYAETPADAVYPAITLRDAIRAYRAAKEGA